ncbi:MULTISPECIES: sugar-binding transcriptional regulator [Rhodococcus]|uniref:Sugar-binding domain-containing protein n=1 Tax=Rhodococcus oxybenzonivorans TaxID=1990687 RepID=A0AAE4V375_9NOCA|nr:MULTISPECIES: sugar-binding domain-containing protein [Rhodococcus]MDV7241650.1 sugar-binding domain-containing protein [Rhodococcus oxybenzonivorans]MDV7267432.1 sugar-binding domain-containing protein [Rhodococcus oxybenzonivorans]MDV7273817.1 sugar-binding domain-containing protein [Rhodococcus oxybenzonivorans]MDV7333931.1 sugar-binding domain-containing protein [Rhodococcus oxybenzonivorans]MDV7343350.1 sugar-binding domain-containing protein [Rhodococcus oxybenzonivorans]
MTSPDTTASTPSLTAVPSPSTTEDLRLALRAATLYYLDGLTQAEVATRLGVSRPTAGRLVARAKAQGLVRIEVQVPAHLSDALRSDEERALEERFNLVEAVVVADSVDAAGPIDQHGSFAGVGRAAASLLVRRIRDTDTLGFTWGPETVAVAQGLPSGAAVCATVVQLDGSVSAINYQTGTEYVLGRCAEQLQANTIRLPVPLYADASTVVSMRGDSVISKALEVGRTAQMMMFGTGAVSTSTTLFEGSFLDTDMLSVLTDLGAVGEVGGRFFRLDGTDVDGPLNERAMSVPLDDIRACEGSILVTGGAAKHHAALGALNGGLAKMLVCDIECARWLLDQ